MHLFRRIAPAVALFWIVSLGLAMPGAILAREAPPTTLKFAELEAAGARVGQVRVRTGEIFNTEDANEDQLLFRWANALHIRTQASVIERALLFKTGDTVSVALIEETERLLRGGRYLYDVQIRPLAYRDGVVDIEVFTRDTWSLDPGFSAGRSGGVNSSGIRLKEYNLFGTGMSLSLGRSKSVDRTSTEFQFANDRAFGTWTAVNLSVAQNSDGRRDAVSVVRPFYALDTRWSAGATVSRDDRIEAIYNAGAVVSEYRQRQNKAEVFGGWSRGRVDGWVQRYSLGVGLLDNAFEAEPGRVAPATLPEDERLVAPFVRYELIEDRFEKLQNRNLIAKPEFFALGLASTVSLGWASTALGSTRDTLVYSATISRGFEPAPEHTLVASGSISGQYAKGQVRRQHLGMQARYYLPQSSRWLFFAGASGDMLTNPDPSDTLLLGGDSGLRGYPLRYQSGHRRALLTLEERVFTDLYVWRLLRIGGAAFFDVGRAWGGNNVNTANPGWLGNAGVGLRILSARAAFSNVMHVDVAFPLNATDDAKKVQLLVKTKVSF
ncbi:MAG: BamA/TamA family outer membrane protein [Rubrivivax sp.]|nr:BamA/TamA family outer membrane protein [Rubrivivax sp.]